MSSDISRIKVIQKHLSPSLLATTPTANVRSSFQYTLDGHGALTTQQREFYEINGFVVIKNLIPKQDLDVYRRRFVELCRGQASIPGMTIMKDVSIAKTDTSLDETKVTKLQSFQNDPVLFQYCINPRIVQYARSFTGNNVMAMHTMLINKPPDTGRKTSRHPLHQDLYYFPFRPADRIVASWTAMEKVDRQNGCLVVIPGSHRSGKLHQHDYPKWEGGVNKMYHGVTDFDPNSKFLHLVMEAGDTVFFHPLILHGSGTNVTSRFRKAISCHYASSSCDYIDVRGTIQSAIADEVTDFVQSKLQTKYQMSNVQLEYEDVWKLRAKLVSGEKINL